MNAETTGTLQHLASIFEDTFIESQYEFSIETTQNDIGEWDSLAQIRLITAVEKAFDFQFDIHEIENLKSVSAFVDAIHSKLARTCLN